MSTDETQQLIQKQREQQMLLGIKVRVISPAPITPELLEQDKKFYIERRYIDPSFFSVPSQIVIYGKKIGIVSYTDGTNTSILNNEEVNITLQSIFELLWKTAKDPKIIVAEL